MDKLARARELRAEAERLELEAFSGRLLPKKWEVGMRVRFLKDQEWAWRKGGEATIHKLSAECKNKSASEYQVFWTQPDSKNASWWTTPSDVELVGVEGTHA